MASPQKENGYVPIANELFEALCAIRISGEVRQIIDTVFRKTYGFNKKQDAISLSQFCISTRLRKCDVCRAINKAISMNILKLISKKANGDTNIYSINKDFDSWKPLAKKQRGVAKKQITISKIANNRLQKSNIQKTVSKDTLTKDKYSEQSSQAIFNFEEYIKRMEEHTSRHVQVIAFYFRKKKIAFKSLKEAQSAIRRHLRPAKEVANFDDDAIFKAYKVADREYPTIYTVETLHKILTR